MSCMEDLMVPAMTLTIDKSSEPVVGNSHSPQFVLADVTNVYMTPKKPTEDLSNLSPSPLCDQTMAPAEFRNTSTGKGNTSPIPANAISVVEAGSPEEADWAKLSQGTITSSLARELLSDVPGLHGLARDTWWKKEVIAREKEELDAPMLPGHHSDSPSPDGNMQPRDRLHTGFSSLASFTSSPGLSHEADSDLSSAMHEAHTAGPCGSTTSLQTAASTPSRLTPSPVAYCGRKLRHLEGMLRISVQRLLQVEAQKRAMQTALQREIAALQLQLNGVLRVNAADLSAAQGEVALLKTENDRKAKRIEELQKELERCQEEAELRRRQAAEAEMRREEAQRDFQLLKSGLEVKDSALVELQRQNINLQQELEITRFDHRESKCMLCNIDFTLFRRAHHCRKCHRVACNRCAPHRSTAEFPELGPHPTRVCGTCLEIHIAQTIGVM